MHEELAKLLKVVAGKCPDNAARVTLEFGPMGGAHQGGTWPTPVKFVAAIEGVDYHSGPPAAITLRMTVAEE
jgi:hypothetical protein